MTFEDWRSIIKNAESRSSGVERDIAQRADMPACYETQEKEEGFKKEVAGKGLASWPAYEDVCKRHPCIGRQVDAAHLPSHVVRTMSVGSFLKAIWHSAPGGGYGGQPLVASPRPGTWEKARELLPTDAGHETFFFPAKPNDPSQPEARSVFANFHEGDPDPHGAGQPRPELLALARRHTPARGSLADCVVWLTARKRPDRGSPMALVSYPHAAVGECRFPVPPDAGSVANAERFRPVPPGTDEKYGRTWPEGVTEVGHLAPGNGVPELVHWNRKIPVAEVFVLNMERTDRG